MFFFFLTPFSVLWNLATSSFLKEADGSLFILSRVPSLYVITVPDNRGNVYHSWMLFGAPSRQNPFSPGHTHMYSGVLGNLLIPFVALWNSMFTFLKVSVFPCCILEYSVPGVIPNACSALSKEDGGM